MNWPASQTIIAIVAAFIAACAARIAHLQKEIANQQMEIARLKLNHDLFDRRFAIYVATTDYMIACLNREGGTKEDAKAFYDATRSAAFLFDKSINEFIAELWRQSVALQVFGDLRRNPITPEAALEYDEKCHKAREWVFREYEFNTIRFQRVIDLSNIFPFSIEDVPSLNDASKLREELTKKI